MKYPRREREFFLDYATYVLRLCNNPQIQQRLRWLVEVEGIEIDKTIDLRIMLFPARPLHGRPRHILHGSYNHDTAQISIYPLKVKKDLMRRECAGMFKAPTNELTESQKSTIRQIFESAVRTLIHEILHVKFENRNLSRYAEEAIVQKLEEKYSAEWMGSLAEPFEFGQLVYAVPGTESGAF